MSNAPFLPLLLTIIEAVGTLAFALSGLLEAARKRLDAVGVCLVAGLAAFGGGTLRDVLLDRRPFVWVAHSEWLWVLLALCMLVPAPWVWTVYLIQIGNIAGAAGDFYVVWRFAAMPPDILVRDAGVDMTVYSRGRKVQAQ